MIVPIYTSRSGRNKIYLLPQFAMAYLTDEVSGNSYWFDDKPIRGGTTTVSRELARLIDEKYGGFAAYTSNCGPVATGGGNTPLVHVLYALYHGVTVEDAKAAKAKLRRANPLKLTGGDDVDKFMHRNFRVYDFTEANIKSNATVGGSIGSDTTTIAHDGRLVMIVNGNNKYYTQDTPEMKQALNVLDHLGSWGALKGPRLIFCRGQWNIPFAAIVWAIAHGHLDPDNITPDTLNRVKGLYASRSACVVDHLTENTTNNYTWALAAMPHGVNAALRGRSDIIAPYYFYTVNDVERGYILVHCGVLGYGVDWRLRFDDLTDQAEAELYKSCVLDFCAKARAAKYTRQDAGDRCLLNYWGDPQRAYDPDNPLTQMLHDPLDLYSRYEPGVFDELEGVIIQ